MKLSDKIALLRKAKGYSQEQLAEACNVTRQSVSKWEADIVIPETSKLIFMSDLFKVSLDALLRDDLEVNAVKNSATCGKKSIEEKSLGIFCGTIIKEGLADELILDYVSVNKIELWKTECIPSYWTAIQFTSSHPQFPKLLSKAILNNEDKGGNWYVDMKSGNIKYIVLKDLVLQYKIGDSKEKEAVCQKCRDLGIPNSQLDWSE